MRTNNSMGLKFGIGYSGFNLKCVEKAFILLHHIVQKIEKHTKENNFNNNLGAELAHWLIGFLELFKSSSVLNEGNVGLRETLILI